VGGFVNIAGGKYRIVRLPVPGDTLIPWDKLPKRILAALNGSKPIPKAKQGAPIPDGQRDSTLTRIAAFFGYLRGVCVNVKLNRGKT
jgi:hypothetical protein